MAFDFAAFTAAFLMTASTIPGSVNDYVGEQHNLAEQEVRYEQKFNDVDSAIEDAGLTKEELEEKPEPRPILLYDPLDTSDITGTTSGTGGNTRSSSNSGTRSSEKIRETVTNDLVSPERRKVWRILGACESGNDTDNYGVGISRPNGPNPYLYSGQFQFDQRSWDWAGGQDFASEAWKASEDEQIIVSERLLRLRENSGLSPWAAWPNCSVNTNVKTEYDKLPRLSNSQLWDN